MWKVRRIDEYSTNTLQFNLYKLRIYKIPIRFDSICTNFTNYKLFVNSIGALVAINVIYTRYKV
jgi:hypothetical protein